ARAAPGVLVGLLARTGPAGGQRDPVRFGLAGQQANGETNGLHAIDGAGGKRRRHHSIEGWTTAASATRFGTPSLANACRRWVFTVCGEMHSRRATAPLVSPSATSSDTARSVLVRLSQPRAGRCLGPRGAGRTPRARNRARARPAQPSAPACS